MTEFYTKLADELAGSRDDLQLVITTEDVFAGEQQQRRIREALAGPTQITSATFRAKTIGDGPDFQRAFVV